MDRDVDGVEKRIYSYVSKSDRLGSSDVWLKSPGTWGVKKLMSGRMQHIKRMIFV